MENEGYEGKLSRGVQVEAFANSWFTILTGLRSPLYICRDAEAERALDNDDPIVLEEQEGVEGNAPTEI